jgi:hypothetical protein
MTEAIATLERGDDLRVEVHGWRARAFAKRLRVLQEMMAAVYNDRVATVKPRGVTALSFLMPQMMSIYWSAVRARRRLMAHWHSEDSLSVDFIRSLDTKSDG